VGGGFQVPPGFRALSNNGIIVQRNAKGHGGNVDSRVSCCCGGDHLALMLLRVWIELKTLVFC